MTKPADETRSGARERFAAERERMSRNAIPRLIELLESADLRTRFLAEMCLRDAAST
ncbi:MAG TPA: hypothetical protein VK421_21280 [Pyrinomonadaceae bacterium]|nr:hypothetical protein [Pyrinomonadaceae bacterium]